VIKSGAGGLPFSSVAPIPRQVAAFGIFARMVISHFVLPHLKRGYCHVQPAKRCVLPSSSSSLQPIHDYFIKYGVRFVWRQVVGSRLMNLQSRAATPVPVMQWRVGHVAEWLVRRRLLLVARMLKVTETTVCACQCVADVLPCFSPSRLCFRSRLSVLSADLFICGWNK